ncbi:MAG TPA: guanylyl cyclase [Acidimicrobiaceae bacterium]|nr:guanylyl cyclase [Acidimicrobiaceae bacterium]
MSAEGVELTFCFVDLAGFSALTEAHGDEEAVDLLGRFEDKARAALGSGGRLVKTIGDAVMMAFDAPETALQTTRLLFESCASEEGLPLPRAGLHHGSAIGRGGDYFGASVNLASRVAAQAHGGQALGTASVADVARAVRLNVVELGAFDLHNLSAPVTLFDLGVLPAAAGMAVDPVCRMHVARDGAAGRLRHQGVDYWFCSLACVRSFAEAPGRYHKGR